jgi:hypothetical protein
MFVAIDSVDSLAIEQDLTYPIFSRFNVSLTTDRCGGTVHIPEQLPCVAILLRGNANYLNKTL